MISGRTKQQCLSLLILPSPLGVQVYRSRCRLVYTSRDHNIALPAIQIQLCRLFVVREMHASRAAVTRILEVIER